MKKSKSASSSKKSGTPRQAAPTPAHGSIIDLKRGRSSSIRTASTGAKPRDPKPAAAACESGERFRARVEPSPEAIDRTKDLKQAVASLRQHIEERAYAENDLRTSNERLRNTLESIADGFFTLDKKWRFTHVNSATLRLFQKKRVDLIGRSLWEIAPKAIGTIFDEQYRKAVREKMPVAFEAISPIMNRWVEVRGYPDGDGLVVYFHDISERKEAEQRDAVTNVLLKKFAQKYSRRDYLDTAVELIRDWSGCRSVGVRVADQDGNIPYGSCVGFSQGFLETENVLSIKHHQCACTRVVKGAPEPQDLAAMTSEGSFYLNNSSQFLETLTEEQKGRFRGVCIKSGFSSIAVIPLRYRGEVLGAIHLADERSDMVPLRNVEFLEQLAFIIGEALYRLHIEEALRCNYEALSESERRYRSLVEDVRDIIFTLKADGTIASVSPAFETSSGWPREEWIGKRFTELIHPDDVSFALDIFRRILDDHTLPLFELRSRTRSGEYRNFEYTMTSGRTAQGHILGIARDVTERKQAEEDRVRLAAALEAAADAVVITDPSSGVIQYANHAFEQITGYTKEETLGQTLHFLESGRHDDEYYKGLREALAKDGVWNGRLVNKRKNGSLYFEECTVSPVKNPSGAIINYVYLKRDVTDKLRLESIAESINTMDNIGYVFSGVRHEIGNPINSINLILGILRAKLETLSPEAVKDYLGRMTEQINRVEYILRSLKSFNLYETQEPQTIPVSSFMENFLLLVTDDFRKKNIAIETVIEPGVTASADPRALQQVLLNIVTNAADALSGLRDPRITMNVSRSGPMVSIRVQDNGCGISEEKLKNIFKPFYTTKTTGTGLGLVIVKKMLARMNGTIDIESAKDAGTIVNIAIPERTHEEH